MPVDHGVKTVARTVLAECWRSPGMRTVLVVLLATSVGGVGVLVLYPGKPAAALTALLAMLICMLLLLMSFVTGPLTRDLANGTTQTLLASALRGDQIILGYAVAMSVLATVPGYIIAIGAMAVTNQWDVLGLLSALVVAPALSFAVAVLTFAAALWKGTDVALVAPWVVTLSVGGAFTLMATLGDIPVFGWQISAVFAVMLLFVGLLATAATVATTKHSSTVA